MTLWLKAGDPLQRYQALVEKILADLGLDPSQARQPPDDPKIRYSWSMRFGSAHIFVDLLEENGEGLLRINSPLLIVPEDNREDLFAWLLQLNHSMAETAFALYGDEVHLVSTRPLEGLDPNEAHSIITRLCAYADDLDDELSNEFGARLWTAE